MLTRVKNALAKKNISYNLVPPHLHQANRTECAIQTFECYFIARLASINPNFPLQEQYCLIAQCKLTLNLLRSSCVNPNLSAWAYMFGNFDYNQTPVVPPGTKVVAHLKPSI